MKKVLFLFVFLFSVLGAAAKNLQQVVFKNSMFALYNTRNRALQVAMKPAEIKAEKEYLRPSGNYFIFVSTAKH